MRFGRRQARIPQCAAKQKGELHSQRPVELQAAVTWNREDDERKNAAYLSDVHHLGCYLQRVDPGSHRCSRTIEADHMGERGVGQKAPDVTCVPMCSTAHRMRTDAQSAKRVDGQRNYFASFTEEQMRAWCDEAIGATQALMLSAGSRRTG